MVVNQTSMGNDIWHQPNFLQVTDKLRLLRLIDCIPRKEENLLKFQGHFCAGDGKTFYEAGYYTPDSCKGDSGGPLTYR